MEDDNPAVQTAGSFVGICRGGGFGFTIAHGHETLGTDAMINQLPGDAFRAFLGKLEILPIVALPGISWVHEKPPKPLIHKTLR
ncbi:hypothetical protein GCM10023213_21740 [Prosthecobacter algae]|uniref:Uncharacterized protein n=1 Tax=Prosthecobacter algae TaxID=1144682 RepID=A0ABP9P601_9BACT